MISNAQSDKRQTTSHSIVSHQTYRGHSLDGRPMPCRLDGMILNAQLVTILVYLLTTHYRFHILEKAVDDLEGLCCGYPSLVLGESL